MRSCFYFFQNRRHRALALAVAITILWQAGEAFATHPDYLAYFNEIAGGPSNGYKHLVDSSLDWGQDLPALSSWLHAHEPGREREPVYLSYFGTADPQWYGIVANSLPADSIEHTMIQLQPGVYCISATILQQVCSDAPGRW